MTHSTIASYNPPNIFARARLVYTRHVAEYFLAKTGEYPRLIFLNFQKTARVAKNIWRIIDTIASIWVWKYARIFVLGHSLFLKAHSFPRATLSENSSLLGTDHVRGQISEHVFVPNGGYCLWVPRFCSYHILTSSVIYYWTDARQHGIFLLNRSLDKEAKTSFLVISRSVIVQKTLFEQEKLITTHI